MFRYSDGTLRRSPALKHTPPAKWWIVLDIGDDLGRFYLHLHTLQHLQEPAQRPAWGPHITVVRNEPPPELAAWDALVDGVSVSFQYSSMVESDGRHLWLPVRSEELLDLRAELGLPRIPEFPFHLTIGVVSGRKPLANTI